jgi:hypothetical protein
MNVRDYKKALCQFYIVFKTIYEGIGDFWRREQVRWRCRTISLERKKNKYDIYWYFNWKFTYSASRPK